jgi:hypothetical protein
MYKYDYHYQLRAGNLKEVKYKHKTVLKAKFVFDNEVPPNKRKEVRERCDVNPGQLDNFLTKNLGYRPGYRGDLISKKYYGHRERLTITPLISRLGFRITSESNGQLPLEEMIDLERVNHFVLTGETSNITEEQDK